MSAIRLCEVEPGLMRGSEAEPSGVLTQRPVPSRPASSPPPAKGFMGVVRPAEPSERRARATLTVSKRSQSRRKSLTEPETEPAVPAGKNKLRRRQSAGSENVEPFSGDQLVYYLDDLDFRGTTASLPGRSSGRPASTGQIRKHGHKNPQVSDHFQRVFILACYDWYSSLHATIYIVMDPDWG
jgi:hypothetical protein